MHVLVITRKKRNIILLFFGIVIIILCTLRLIQALVFGSEVVIGYRLSLKVPSYVEMSSIYTAEPAQPFIQTVSALGTKLKTETIRRNDFSEITFQYPETLRMGEIQNLGHEITVHVNFKHNDNKMIGFFQIWNLNQPFEEFIENSKKLSSMAFAEFSEKNIKIQGMNGIVWEYVYISRTQDIKGVEIFIENGSEMYRFSMFVPESNYKPQYKSIIMRMAKSLKIKDTLGAVLLLRKPAIYTF